MDQKYDLVNMGASFRVRALKDFECQGRTVKAGDIGGFVEGYNNLSQEGTCWIFDDAQVVGEAFACDDAYIGGGARVCDEAQISEQGMVIDKAYVGDQAKVMGTAVAAGVDILLEDDCITGHDVVEPSR